VFSHSLYLFRTEFLQKLFRSKTCRGCDSPELANYSLRLLYVPSGNETELNKVLEKVQATLESKTLGQVPIRFEKISEIPHDEGKTRYVISKAQ